MVLGDIFERFIRDAPMPVLFRLLMERALDPDELDRMFEDTATRQYTRELLFSSTVDLIAAVVCRMVPSVRRLPRLLRHPGHAHGRLREAQGDRTRSLPRLGPDHRPSPGRCRAAA